MHFPELTTGCVLTGMVASLALVSCAPATQTQTLPVDASSDSLTMFPPAPPGPEPLGLAPAGASAAQEQALWWVNTIRAQAGLGPMQQVESINISAMAHADYVITNNELYEYGEISLHQEIPTGSGFTGESFWDRMSAAGYKAEPYREVIARQPTAGGAVAHWMESLYHRLPILQPASTHLGYGSVIEGVQFINVMDVGIADGPEPVIGNGVAWPPPGTRGVPIGWDGFEEPQPPSPPDGFPSGPVVTMVFSRGSSVVLTGHQMLDITAEGSVIAHTALSPENDVQLKESSAVALYADSPLEGEHTIEVQLSVQVNGMPVDRTWRFVTERSVACSVLAQDCGVGKACYTDSDFSGVCHWEGVLTLGDECSVQNECASGLTCVKSLAQCGAFCGWSGSDLKSCSALCGPNALLVDAAKDLGVCGISAP